MKKCCFIIPYFGDLPNYFELFAKTCGYNEDYNWIILTDDKKKHIIPDNVKIIKMNFNELRKIIQNKFDFKISLDRPYKLCDYKPAYGYIFEEYIKDYKFWGHCDLDIIIGNLNDFLTYDLFESYDKILCLGHMILYKNTYENNRMFMKEFHNRLLYKEVFTTSNIRVFDETFGGSENINSIFKYYNKKIYSKDLSLNFYIDKNDFFKITYNDQKNIFEVEKYKKAVYIWDNGNLYRYYMNDGILCKEKFLYAHFQLRIMRMNPKVLGNDYFKIVPNKFSIIDTNKITKDNLYKYAKHLPCFHVLKMHIRNKIKKILKRYI